MSQHRVSPTGSSSASTERPVTSRSLDPWAAASRLGGGALVYGLLGWLLDRWWGTEVMTPIGVLFGVGLALYVTFNALRAR